MKRCELVNVNVLAALAAGTLPRRVIKAALGFALGEACLALCLHRVTETTVGEHRYRIRSQVLDELVELLLSAQVGRSREWLTVSFDDGYDDAAQYVASRARSFPEVEFLMFVCPEKTVRRAGFRWDLPRGGVPRQAFDIDVENARADLLALGDAPESRLASAESLRDLASLNNVTLGNHSSLHAVATAVPFSVVSEDYQRSTALFERLWGTQRHFAFPFGTPGQQYDARHVSALQRLGSFSIWSTVVGAFARSRRVPGEVLPRCPIVGHRTVDQLAGWLAVRLLHERLTFRPGTEWTSASPRR